MGAQCSLWRLVYLEIQKRAASAALRLMDGWDHQYAYFLYCQHCAFVGFAAWHFFAP